VEGEHGGEAEADLAKAGDGVGVGGNFRQQRCAWSLDRAVADPHVDELEVGGNVCSNLSDAFEKFGAFGCGDFLGVGGHFTQGPVEGTGEDGAVPVRG